MWAGRAVACVFAYLGIMVFRTFLETGSSEWRTVAVAGVCGAVLYIVGLEGARHRGSRWVQLAGWLMMAPLSLIPSSLLYLPAILVLFALPALLTRFQSS